MGKLYDMLLKIKKGEKHSTTLPLLSNPMLPLKPNLVAMGCVLLIAGKF